MTTATVTVTVRIGWMDRVAFLLRPCLLLRPPGDWLRLTQDISHMPQGTHLTKPLILQGSLQVYKGSHFTSVLQALIVLQALYKACHITKLVM